MSTSAKATGYGFLEYAETDLAAAKVLHKDGILNLSLFHVCQCFEKLVKCVCLSIPIDVQGNSIAEVKEVITEHNYSKLFIKMSDKIFEKVASQNPSQANNANLFLQSGNRLKQSLSNITGKESKKDILSCLNYEVSETSTETTIKFPDGKKLTILKKNSELVTSLMNKYLFPLGLAGALVSVHYDSTRYPITNNNVKIDLKDYQQKKVGAVETLPELINHLEKWIIIIKKDII